MIAYHATLTKNALSIINDKKIVKTNNKNSIYGVGKGLFNTTEGYIYLATTLSNALDFGLRAWGRSVAEGIDIKKEIYIFEVILDDNIEMFADEDEMLMNGFDYEDKLLENIQKTGSFRIKDNLLIGKHIVQFVKFNFNNMSEGYKLVDNKDLSKGIEWITIN